MAREVGLWEVVEKVEVWEVVEMEGVEVVVHKWLVGKGMSRTDSKPVQEHKGPAVFLHMLHSRPITCVLTHSSLEQKKLWCMALSWCIHDID